MITIQKASIVDVKIIQKIAYNSWPSTYGTILSKEQLDYMLEKFYAPETLIDLMTNKGHSFILIHEANS